MKTAAETWRPNHIQILKFKRFHAVRSMTVHKEVQTALQTADARDKSPRRDSTAQVQGCAAQPHSVPSVLGRVGLCRATRRPTHFEHGAETSLKFLGVFCRILLKGKQIGLTSGDSDPTVRGFD